MLPLNTITKENLNLIDEKFNKYQSAVIFGKGPTFQIIKKEKEEELFICVNETLNYIDDCDMLIITDIEKINVISLERLKDLKWLLVPEFLHFKCRYNPNVTWKTLLKKIKDYFSGQWIIFNLRTNPKPNKILITLPSTLTAGNLATNFVCLHLNKYIKEIKYYGIGIKTDNTKPYASEFTRTTPHPFSDHYIEQIRKQIINDCDNAKIKYELF